jgi:hypothetical protein
MFNLFNFNKKERSCRVALELQLLLSSVWLLDNTATMSFKQDLNYSWILTCPTMANKEVEQWDFFFSLFGTLNRKKGCVATEIRKHSSRALARLQWGPKTFWDSVCKREASFESELFIERGK